MTNCFNMQCPKCSDTDQIDIQGAVWLRLTDDGTEADSSSCGDHTWESSSTACCAACGHTGTVADFTPEESTTRKIAELNDRFRKSTLSLDPVAISLGKKVMTSGIRDLGLAATVEIAERVAAFDSFIEDNDPHGEHDFGSFDHDGNRIFWKIDYYDRASFGSGRDMGSENPSDPAKTLRVLTIMLASEY